MPIRQLHPGFCEPETPAAITQVFETLTCGFWDKKNLKVKLLYVLHVKFCSVDTLILIHDTKAMETALPTVIQW